MLEAHNLNDASHSAPRLEKMLTNVTYLKSKITESNFLDDLSDEVKTYVQNQKSFQITIIYTILHL